MTCLHFILPHSTFLLCDFSHNVYLLIIYILKPSKCPSWKNSEKYMINKSVSFVSSTVSWQCLKRKNNRRLGEKGRREGKEGKKT